MEKTVSQALVRKQQSKSSRGESREPSRGEKQQ